MDILKIEPTKFIPEIRFDPNAGLLEIKGNSYPENTAEFYAPVISWLEDYLSEPADRRAVVNVELTYFNSSSSKVLMNIFDMLENAAKKGAKIQVNWIYDPEDENILEFGEEFQEDFENAEFRLTPKAV
jgi:hypothetical protein